MAKTGGRIDPGSEKQLRQILRPRLLARSAGLYEERDILHWACCSHRTGVLRAICQRGCEHKELACPHQTIDPIPSIPVSHAILKLIDFQRMLLLSLSGSLQQFPRRQPVLKECPGLRVCSFFSHPDTQAALISHTFTAFGQEVD